MKKYLFLTIVVVFNFASISFGQRAIVTSQKYKFTYKTPIGRKTMTVNYPRIKDLNGTPVKKIEDIILNEYAQMGVEVDSKKKPLNYNVDEVDYRVNYNEKGFLAITLWVRVVTAYPNELKSTVVINLKNGTLVTSKDVFITAKTSELSAKVRNLHLQHFDKESELYSEDEYLKWFEKIDLDYFLIDDKGITFICDYELIGRTHDYTDVESKPTGAFLTWEELQGYINPQGPFGQFIPKH